MQSGAFIINDSSRRISLKHSPGLDSGIDSPANVRLGSKRNTVHTASTPRTRKSRGASFELPAVDLVPIVEDDETTGGLEQQLDEDIDLTPTCSSTPTKQKREDSINHSASTDVNDGFSLQIESHPKELSVRNLNVSPKPRVKRKSTQVLGNETKTRNTNSDDSL